MSRKNSVKQFTERAIEATDLDELIPPIVYLPQRLRAQGIRLTVDNLRLTIDPPTLKENHVRIAKADPLGFLIAMLNGQPIPSFEITSNGAVKIRYWVADQHARERVAKFLASRVTVTANDLDPRTKNTEDKKSEWSAMIDQAGTLDAGGEN